MKAGVPILFDEITPGKGRGTRPGMMLEDIKHMCEVSLNSTVDGRCRDISFHQDQPRIFTSNAYGPHGWHPELPAGVWEQPSDVRKYYEPDVKAVFKRVVFCHVDTNIIPAVLRRAHRVSRFGTGASSSTAA